jgi:hypothetical protein
MYEPKGRALLMRALAASNGGDDVPIARHRRPGFIVRLSRHPVRRLPGLANGQLRRHRGRRRGGDLERRPGKPASGCLLCPAAVSLLARPASLG